MSFPSSPGASLFSIIGLRRVPSPIRRRVSPAVMVVHDHKRVVGYYGLAPTAVVSSVLPRSIRTGQPPDPVPCLLLGQLATDLAWVGQGIGTGLLKHALERFVTAARLLGGP